MAFGFPKISNIRGETLMENVNETCLLPQTFFSFKLSINPGVSVLTIGGADDAAFKSDTLVSVPVMDDSEGFWKVDLERISHRWVGHAVPESVNVPAIIDTGTALIFVPLAIAASYYANISGAHLWDNGVYTGASHL